jgi:hypothetical protein
MTLALSTISSISRCKEDLWKLTEEIDEDLFLAEDIINPFLFRPLISGNFNFLG